MSSDTLHVRPIETKLVTSSSPEPVYKDENITVYGIPILPSPSPESNSALLHTEDASLKRKRSPARDYPSKRVATSHDNNSLSSTTTLDQAMSHPDFSPISLSGNLAQEWRFSMVKMMFPASKKHENEITKEKKKEANLVRKKVGGKAKGEIEVSEPQVVAPKPEPDPVSSGNIDIYKRAHVPDGYHRQLPSFSYTGGRMRDAPPAVAYAVVGPRIRGKFDAKKAQELGIPNGPIRRRLINGETVTFKIKVKEAEDDNVSETEVDRTVKAEECVGESETPSVILIFDIPSPAYIAPLLSSFEDPSFLKFKSRSPQHRKEHIVRSMFHIVGEGVLEDERYIQFMKSFEEDNEPIHHLVASREHCPDPVTFTSAAFNQLRLNQLDERLFTIPKFSLTPVKNISSIPKLPSLTHLMAANHTISMHPFKAPVVDASVQDNFHPAIKTNKPVPVPPWTAKKFHSAKKSVASALKRSRRRSKSIRGDRSEGESENESVSSVRGGRHIGVLPLGTGSAIPSKYRNVSSTLITIPEGGNILLDAGEGTWGQLVRHYGLGQGPKAAEGTSDDVWQVLRDLKCIFISHIHADHHMGLATILAKRRMLDPPPKDPLYLVSIRAVHLYLRELSDLQNLGIIEDDSRDKQLHAGSGVVPVMSEALHYKQYETYQTSGMWQIGGTEPWLDIQRSRLLASHLCRSLGLVSFQTVDMYHRTRCYGTVIRHQDGWSIAFSADTLPVNTLVWAGKDATLMIHEATMADGQEELALKKAHSTFGQAIEVGRKMNAEHILLTHFSARYPKMPPSAVGMTKPDDDPIAPTDSSISKESRGRARSPSGAIKKRREPVVAVAFDHLNLTIGEMWKLNHYLPAIEQSFLDTLEEGDDEADENVAMEIDLT
ncbi:hypothetical protein AX15_002105 [Amanita polypyramis BW_CC]|nr:hypothetical protein AX15_002105 [Amanita polypyramis BW_CC]